MKTELRSLLSTFIPQRCSFQHRYTIPIRSAGLTVALFLTLPILGCSPSPTTESAEPPTDAKATADLDDKSGVAQPGGTGFGTLVINANGEDFVRQGFTDKDGWQISFDHVYVTLGDIVAAQSDPPFEAGKGQSLEAKEQVKVAEPITVDLAEGDTEADPIAVVEIPEAPSGRYNALAWRLAPAEAGPAAGYPLMMVGSATKANETIPFQIQLADQLAFSCGDFVGDERKGILESSDTADVEATFHFDHLFGDGEAAADDEINTGALGFGTLAALADGGKLTLNSEQLEEQMSAEDYSQLKTILASLGHVGEGHCEATQVTQ